MLRMWKENGKIMKLSDKWKQLKDGLDVKKTFYNEDCRPNLNRNLDECHITMSGDTITGVHIPHYVCKPNMLAQVAQNYLDEYKTNKIMPGVTTNTNVADVMNKIAAEVQKATSKYPKMNSAHEGYAVILEELDEVWEHVKMKESKRDLEAMKIEAIQTAAMCVRFATECCNKKEFVQN
jgi:hypothetical protein